jgi:hypothetical protein
VKKFQGTSLVAYFALSDEGTKFSNLVMQEGFSSMIGLPKPTLDISNVSSGAEAKPDLKKASAKLRRFDLVFLYI